MLRHEQKFSCKQSKELHLQQFSQALQLLLRLTSCVYLCSASVSHHCCVCCSAASAGPVFLYRVSFDNSYKYENVSCHFMMVLIHIEFRQKTMCPGGSGRKAACSQLDLCYAARMKCQVYYLGSVTL